MKNAVEQRILIFAFVVLAVTIAVNTGFSIDGFRRDYRDGIVLRCQYLATGLKSSVEKVLALGIDIAEIDGINARCQEIVRTDPEIVYCVVENALGTVLFSNDPGLRSLGDSEFVGPIGLNTVRLRVPPFGLLYDVSATIFAPDGKVAGRIRLGFPETVIDQLTHKVLRRSALVLGIAFLLVFGVVALVARRDFVRPLRHLATVSRQIASGDFNVSIPGMTTREFEELGVALREMARSLHERDQKIQDGYAELELANRELQSSYEHQERISVELAHSREMYRTLLEDASDAILVIDDEDRIVLVNKAAEIFFGITRGATVGCNLFVILSRLGGDIDAQYDMFRRIRSGEIMESELIFSRMGSEERLIGWLQGSVVAGPDGRRMVQIAVRDVTREREIKDNLERLAVDLKNLNQMKNSFLGMASHELKTPLTVIIGYSELILSDASGRVDDNMREMVRYISEAAERLSNIVRDMIDVSLLDRRRLNLRKRAADINTLVRSAAREMEFFFQARNQVLTLNLGDDLPAITCDPDRILQVLSNLIGNAVKFTPDMGRITIETRLHRLQRGPRKQSVRDQIELLDQRVHTYVEIIVSDNGIGIDATDQLQIFEKFFEVGNIEEHFTGKMAFKGRGTGLGLTIVKGVVDMHGGAVWVDSPGHDPQRCPGSAFHILLPITPPEFDGEVISEVA